MVKNISSTNYENRNEYITDKRNFTNNKQITQYVGERIIEKNTKNKEIYRYDTIEKIDILDYKKETYTMSVDDPLHQFVADGVIHKNTAFHCNLKSFIKINKELKLRKMKTRLIGQIHDSMIFDAVQKEIPKLMDLLKYTVCEWLPNQWKWINIPFELEATVFDKGKHLESKKTKNIILRTTQT